MSASFVYWKPAQSCVLSSTVLSERASPWGLSSWVAHEKVTSTVFGTSLSLSASSSCSFLCSGCSHIYSSTIWDCLKSRSFLGSSCSVKKKPKTKHWPSVCFTHYQEMRYSELLGQKSASWIFIQWVCDDAQEFALSSSGMEVKAKFCCKHCCLHTLATVLLCALIPSPQ